ncbi:hypothetical protein EXN66_Car005732 [Channa argus]|uniref:Uncharacterized protein n=1 Tax=Channa argus TaxID=215402 RepID=A0A6G1PID6_CHAAH|nr:hypothetical protein EXN66_Car005732 [Channa argus]
MSEHSLLPQDLSVNPTTDIPHVSMLLCSEYDRCQSSSDVQKKKPVGRADQ